MLAAADYHAGRAQPEAEEGPCSAHVLVAAGDARTVTLLREAVHRICPGSRQHVAGSANEVRDLLAVLRPGLAVVDLDFVHSWPRELVTLARRYHAGASVVVVAGRGGDDALLAALRAGAAGFLLKHDPLDEVAAQFRNALAGVLPMTPALAREIVREADRTGAVFTLERGDREVLAWVAAGDGLAQVAERLSLGGEEILRRVDRIYAAFGLRLESDSNKGGTER